MAERPVTGSLARQALSLATQPEAVDEEEVTGAAKAGRARAKEERIMVVFILMVIVVLNVELCRGVVAEKRIVVMMELNWRSSRTLIYLSRWCTVCVTTRMLLTSAPTIT